VTIGSFTLAGGVLLASARHEEVGFILLALAGGQLLFHLWGDWRRKKKS
jgi:hypothetical protein